MNENLDLTEILKDCPERTKFYSSYLGKDVLFIAIYDNCIECEYPSQTDSSNCIILFRKEGSLYKGGECMIFPSKDQRDWSKWHRPFKDGDLVATNDGKYIAIIKNNGGKYYVCCHPNVNYFSIDRSGWFDRLATEEEKQKIFDVIKANGYQWNAETKTLEKIKKEKFDPKTFQPFDKVLVSCNDEWFCDFFSHYDDTVVKFNCICTGGCPYDCCIPYNEDTKHLIGKSIEDAPEFYRYWEE